MSQHIKMSNMWHEKRPKMSVNQFDVNKDPHFCFYKQTRYLHWGRERTSIKYCMEAYPYLFVGGSHIILFSVNWWQIMITTLNVWMINAKYIMCYMCAFQTYRGVHSYIFPFILWECSCTVWSSELWLQIVFCHIAYII